MPPFHQRQTCVCALLVRSKLLWKAPIRRHGYAGSAPPKIDPPSFPMCRNPVPEYQNSLQSP
jgi:hypothetical protein